MLLEAMLPLLSLSLLTPLKAVAVVSFIALLLGFVIVIVFRFFSVETDPREEEINELLPGINCGGCGYSGCSGYAAALASGEDENLSKCTGGGQKTMDDLAAYFGQAAGAFIPKVAVVRCQGSQDYVRVRYEYTGSVNCHTASNLFGGPGTGSYGCLGMGDCQRACQYGAIYIENGLAHVDPTKCIACGACVLACPKNLITIEHKYSDLFLVRCSNPLPGKDVRGNCEIGCIACTLCEKNCPSEAIHMEAGLPVIDQDLCTHCGKCVEVCPTKAMAAGLGSGKKQLAEAKVL